MAWSLAEQAMAWVWSRTRTTKGDKAWSLAEQADGLGVVTNENHQGGQSVIRGLEGTETDQGMEWARQQSHTAVEGSLTMACSLLSCRTSRAGFDSVPRLATVQAGLGVKTALIFGARQRTGGHRTDGSGRGKDRREDRGGCRDGRRPRQGTEGERSGTR